MASAEADTAAALQRQQLGRTQAGEVSVSIEKPSFSSRRIVACTSILAPPSAVWGALTNYEGLSDFIPSLVENRCLERGERGAVLYQVGAQDVALGVKFRAATTLAIREHRSGLSQEMCLVYDDPDESEEGDDGNDFTGLYPCPEQTLAESPIHGDITFDQLEGDFRAFKGLWRIQQGLLGPDSSWLIYSLYVRPQAWLPVQLIQDRISREVVSNLRAVARHSEASHQRLVGSGAPAAS